MKPSTILRVFCQQKTAKQSSPQVIVTKDNNVTNTNVPRIIKEECGYDVLLEAAIRNCIR